MGTKLCCIWSCVTFAVLSQAQPSFTADRVLPSGGTKVRTLTPGMLVSIYGRGLGPDSGCQGSATQLCGVQVFLGELPARLLWVQREQINFEVPQGVPVEGTSDLKVLYEGRSNAPVRVATGVPGVGLSVDGIARVGGPVWINVDLPPGWGEEQYPVRIAPGDFGCAEFEVRHNGADLSRIAVRTGPMVHMGLVCGHIGIAGVPMRHLGRLPLHLQYRFDKPGVYEIRYTRNRGEFGMPRAPSLRSAWTRIQVLPAEARIVRVTPPDDPVEILSDFLPAALGFGDAESLPVVMDYLYHSNDTVRQFAAMGLRYWPQDDVERKALELVRTKGPTDALLDVIGQRATELADMMVPYLKSDNPVLLRGAIAGLSRLTGNPKIEGVLVDAAEHVLRVGDEQTVTIYAGALGVNRDDRARDVLWSFVERRVALEQSLIALTWHKDPRDLGRLGVLLEQPARGNPKAYEFVSLPYALRNAFGAAALPFLETGLRVSGYVFVRTNCARELILSGRPAGFAFVARAMEEDAFYKREMADFVRERFPELVGKSDADVLAFVKQRGE